MLPEPLDSPAARLNVARRASLAEVEAAFARCYKAARRGPFAEARQQALNDALAVLRDPDAAALAAADSYWLVLEPDQAWPEQADLVATLLPWPDSDPLAVVPVPTAEELTAAEITAEPAPPLPSDDALEAWLLAHLALALIDPWEDLP
ncbi:MAG: hypothetical protein IT204_24830 [Fimbriimonadaceae bacterium]|nr:hypothetical protein [Fimbriimonadaceae bacterium]